MGELTGYRAQVALAARAVSVRSAESFAWFGRASPPLPTSVRGSLPAELAREHLLGGLSDELYRSFYLHGEPLPLRDGHDPQPAPDVGFVDALSAANASRGGRDGGWSVTHRDDEHVWLVRGGLSVRAHVTQYRDDSLPRPRESRVALPGFFLINGDTAPTPGGIELRVYFQLAPAAAPALVAGLTQRLNATDIPFDLKLHAHPHAFARPDAAVLYLDSDGFEPARATLRAVHDACDGAWRDFPPPFSKPIARGLAVGEHVPAHGLSFGTARCRLLAEGLVAAHEHGVRDLEVRVETVAQRFAAAGLDLDRPFLAPGSHDRYRL